MVADKDPRRYFFIAGEASGDSHAAPIAAALLARSPLSTIAGIVGPRLREAGAFAFHDIDALAVMGFSDVFRALPRLLRLFHKVKRQILDGGFDLVFFIDAPAFNLRMAQALRRHGYKGKLVQYISPSVWAHGHHRIDTMEKNLDGLLTIFPFEQQHYAGRRLPVAYVGNPTAERLAHHRYQDSWRESPRLPSGKKIIALYPGSRKSEILRHLPMMLEAAAPFVADPMSPYHLAVSCSNESFHTMIQQEALLHSIKWDLNATMVPASSCHYELMQGASCALAKSGTVTLELALHHCPTVVAYNTTAMNRFIAKHLLRLSLPHYCIVNIIMGKEIFPEYIAAKASPQSLHSALRGLLDDEVARRHCLDGCHQLKQMLATPYPSHNVADILEAIT